MKLLITGGGGFLGARLARTLLRRGNLAGEWIDAVVLTDSAGSADEPDRAERGQAQFEGARAASWS